MRLYLSSYQLGSDPQALVNLLGPNKHAAIIANAMDLYPSPGREPRVRYQASALAKLGCAAEEHQDLREWMRDEAKGMKGKVAPLPEITAFTPPPMAKRSRPKKI